MNSVAHFRIHVGIVEMNAFFRKTTSVFVHYLIVASTPENQADVLTVGHQLHGLS